MMGSTSSRSSPISSLDHARIPANPNGRNATSKEASHIDANGHINGTPRNEQQNSWVYPSPPESGGVYETVHGVPIRDPWRELETLESEATQRFIKDQNELSIPLLKSHPRRSQLEQSVEKSYSHERTSSPALQGDGYYYWLFNPGTAPRDMMIRSNNLTRDFGKVPAPAGGSEGPEVVFDLNKEKDISLYTHSFSPSGRYWSAILQESGSDWQNIRTIDTVTKQVVEDDLTEAKFTFGTTWIGDKGFLYKRVIVKGGNFAGADGAFGYYYHQLGTQQSADVLIWHGTGPSASNLIVGKPKIMTSDDKIGSEARAWLFFDIYRNTNPETECFVVPLPQDLDSVESVGETLTKLVMNEARWISRGYTGETHYVGTLSNETHLFFSTADGASTGRVLALDSSEIDDSAPKGDLICRELVAPQAEGLILNTVNLVDDRLLILVYLRDACAAVVFVNARTGEVIGSTDRRGTRGHATTSTTTDIPVPSPELEHDHDHTTSASVIPKHAAISNISSRSDSDEVFLTVDTFIAPPYVLCGKVVDGEDGLEVKLARLQSQAEGKVADDLVCHQVFYTSHDGVKVPMFICHARDLDRSKPQHTLLHAYGGSAVPIVPSHNPFFESFMRELRGVVAIANIRGGGEYGKQWHEAALGVKRAVAFDDFAWAAKYLHESGISEPKKTAIYGTSNGGLLVSASVNRHPELFGVALPDVPVIDLTRFHKFTLGRYWVAEYGNPEDPKALPIIHSLSPLHNVNPEPLYPAILVTTGDHDTRVIPGHSLKYLAELQFLKRMNKNIFLGRIYANAGHESGSKSLEQKVEEAADRLVFLVSHLQ